MLRDLLDKKGSLSRQIGEAKRSGQSIDDLLDEMKRVSSQIKTLQGEQKAKRPADKPAGTKQSEVLKKVPLLFDADCFATDESRFKVQIRLLDGDQDADQWDDYVAHRPHSSIYHFWAFRRIVSEAFGHNTLYLAAFNPENKVCGILPAIELKSRLFGHFIVSLPFFTYGAALADNEEIEQQLYDSLFDLAANRHAEHVELRCTSVRPSIQEKCTEKQSKVSMIRELPDSVDALWKDLGTKVRAQIKKAQRHALKIKFGGLELLDDFYRVFSVNMRDLGTPVYSRQFFANMLQCELKANFHVGVVYFDAKPVACCFLMSHQNTMEIPWASTLQTANHMNVNMYMYWEVLKKTINEGHEFFDFGRSSIDGGTYRFKKQWGAQGHKLYWYYWLPKDTVMPELNPDNPKYKLLIKIWQKLPVWFTRLIGPPVVKYLP